MLSSKPYVQTCGHDSAIAQVPAAKQATTDALHKDTYQRLRWGMMVVAIVFPVVLWLASNYQGIGEQPSMSAFYHTRMRDVFVAIVFGLGVCLYVYKGYNELEDACLTLAGICLFGVAWAPTAAPQGSTAWDAPVIHNVCASSFFILIAIVCIFAREHGLTKTNGANYDLDYRSSYNVTAVLMILILAIAIALFCLDKFADVSFKTSTFWIEASAIWVFAWYWGLKSRELASLE